MVKWERPEEDGQAGTEGAAGTDGATGATGAAGASGAQGTDGEHGDNSDDTVITGTPTILLNDWTLDGTNLSFGVSYADSSLRYVNPQLTSGAYPSTKWEVPEKLWKYGTVHWQTIQNLTPYPEKIIIHPIRCNLLLEN